MPIDLPSLLATFVLAAYALGGILVLLPGSLRTRWRIGLGASFAALIVAAGAALFTLVPIGGLAGTASAGWLDVDALGLTILLLLALLGAVIMRYSRTYLEGEAGQPAYVAALCATLASVALVLLTGNLGWMVAAWILGSFSLHRLLIFYAARPAAQIAAHKKFLADRLADLALVVGTFLVWQATGTLAFDGIGDALAGADPVPWSIHLAGVLLALGVILKTAQLPVHGWLIQVMEAPTPVSALLHAGVVNLGGFVLIRLAALLDAVPSAQALLVVVGSLTAVLAAFVMSTRITIKVRLAWSTCAQMGFMILQCGLGLYALAALHLVFHSLYKAYAFLAAGGAVEEARVRRLAPHYLRPQVAGAITWHLAAAALTLALAFAADRLWLAAGATESVPTALLLVVGLALAPLVWQGAVAASEPAPGRHGRGGSSAVLGAAGGAVLAFAIVNLYLLWHVAFGHALDLPVGTPPVWLLFWTAGCFLLLYVLQALLLAWRGELERWLHVWAYAGLYLDERFTRLTFALWPPSLPRRRRAWSKAGPVVGLGNTTMNGERS